MKQMTVISGKGGTGKTMISASFIALSGGCAAADCDVDAANLHLLLEHKVIQTDDFKAGKKAEIKSDKCTGCGRCGEVCRFEAVLKEKKYYTINPLLCEGCGFCARVCPENAVAMSENTAGELYASQSLYGPFIHAKLGIAEDNSGKLAAKVREDAKNAAEKAGRELVIIDGPPGTGCPVMASLTGVDLAVIVTEPTVSGLHDLDRAARVAGHFGVEVCVIINKYDISTEKTNEIIDFCRARGIACAGSVSFSESVLNSVIKGIPPSEGADEKIKKEIRNIWDFIHTKLFAGAVNGPR
ncbi:MAG: ATP-binding protein [Candidatus Goldiibacteriota bacterium]